MTKFGREKIQISMDFPLQIHPPCLIFNAFEIGNQGIEGDVPLLTREPLIAIIVFLLLPIKIKTFMKISKYLVCACIMGTALVGFSGCSEDDEKDYDDGNGLPAQELPSVSNAGIKFPVLSFSRNGEVWSYCYDANGRMLSCESAWEKCAYKSNPLSVYATYGEKDSDGWKSYENIRVNDGGFMTSCSGRYFESNGETGGFSATFTYDNEGHLLSEDAIMTEDGHEADYEKWTMNYTWIDGNLTKIVTNGSYKNTEEGEEGTDQEVVVFTYDMSRYSNSGIYYFADILIGTWLLDSPSFFYSGLMGRTTKNIPMSYTITYSEDGEEEYSDSYELSEVAYNADGSIKSIKCEYAADYSYGTFCSYGYAAYSLPDMSYNVASQFHSRGLKRHRIGARK